MNTNVLNQIELVQSVCSNVWKNSQSVQLAAAALDAAKQRAILNDTLSMTVISSLQKELVSEIVSKLDCKDDDARAKVAEYLMELGSNDGLPYNFGTKSETYLRTEKQCESYTENLLKAYYRIKRGARQRKNDKDTKIAFAVSQLQNLGIELTLAISSTAKMNGVTEDYVTNVVARAAGQSAE